MPRYAAFLRGVSPGKPNMGELRQAFEAAGFTDVKTLRSSGNVVFTAAAASDETLQRRAEAGIKKQLGREFLTIVRSIQVLRELLASDPYGGFRMEPGAKRVATFLKEPPASKIALPVELHGARILALKGKNAFSAYVRSPKGPVFMQLIEKAFGREQTTRTWETIEKVVSAGQG